MVPYSKQVCKGVDRMKFQEIVDKLDRCRILKNRIEEKQREYAEALPSGVRKMSGMPSGHSGIYEPERYARKREDLLANIGKMKDELSRQSADMMPVWQLIDGNERRAILGRYYRKMTWQQIADGMKCHRRSVERWHDKAIQKITEKA